MRAFALLLLIASLARAVLVDQIAITVGPTVITELQIDEDIRVAALLSDKPIVRDSDKKRAAADRLVEQLLIQHEIEISQYPGPADQQVEVLFNSVERTEGGKDRLQSMLSEYQVSEATLRAHLKAQLSTLQFIEFRFRPDVNVTDTEVEQAYQRQLASGSAGSSLLPPSLDANERARLSQVLIEERTDAALDRWLAESRKQVTIRYLDPSLQ